MIRGHLDAVTSGGFAEGWAFDSDSPQVVVTVALRAADGTELGRGLANLHRADMADLGFRFGWCAFRVRLSQTGTQLFGTRLTLVELNGGTEVHSTEEWRLREAREAPLSSIEAIVGEDPTVLRSVLQLSGYAPMMAAFVERHGVKDFVRTAAVYMLGRLPDEAGLESYERLLENGAVTPFGLFAMLGASEELKTAPRLLQSPVHPGFLFAG
jgi:hypothetical protein